MKLQYKRGKGMNKEELLKLFHKYGFYSEKKEPFLYVNKDKTGILYQIKHPFYGTLKRIYLPQNESDAEDFLAKYYYYKKNGEKNHITLEVDDYKIENPNPIFKQNGEIKTLEELRNQKENKKSKEEQKQLEKEKNYCKKLKRTLLLLLKIIEEKIKNQTTTYENLIELTNTYIEKQNELEEKLERSEKTKQLKKIVKETPDDVSSELKEWQKEIETLEEPDILEQTIPTLIEFLKSLELDDGLLKNKYELIKLPLEIDIMKEKLDIIEKFSKKKKGLFQKKENIETELQEVEEKSTLKNIVTFKHYKENETKRIEEKYSVIPDLDKRTIADYLIEFDNLKISEPIIEEPTLNSFPEEKQVISFEQTMKELEESFQNRPKEEQEDMICLDYCEKNWLQGKGTKDFIEFIENPNNIMIKIKYFKKLDFSSIENCKKSIQNLRKQRINWKEELLQRNINVFFKDVKQIPNRDFLKTSSKRNLAPSQEIGENDVTYIADVKENTTILFLPNELVSDIENDEVLKLEERPYFYIDLEKNHIVNENSAIIKVVDYEGLETKEEKLTIITELKRKKINLFKHITIERKMDND